MANKLILLASVLTLTSCNLWGGIDKPSGDEQILSRARGCLDRGDYACATEYYAKLSASQNDTRLAETALVAMAQDGIFSTADLIASLGNGRGSATSFTQIANYIAKRGKTGASYRITLDNIFVNANDISNSSLKNYTQFLIALAMTNQILASISGSDQTLTAADISSSPNTCRTTTASCNDPGSFPDTSTGGTPTSWTGAGMNSQWGNPASVDMFIVAASVAQAKFVAIGGNGSGQGIIQALNQLGGITGAAKVKRQALLTTLFQ
jgi:hypothetical protein